MRLVASATATIELKKEKDASTCAGLGVCGLREVLEDDACGPEGNLHRLCLGLLPGQDALHILPPHQEAVAVPHCRLQQHADGEGQALCGAACHSQDRHRVIENPHSKVIIMHSFIHSGTTSVHYPYET